MTTARHLPVPEYLTREQLADELSISVRTLKQYESEGLRIHWLGGKVYRFLRSEVNEWIARRPQERELKEAS